MISQVNPVCFDTQVVQEDDSSYDEHQLSPLHSKEAVVTLTISNPINKLGVTKETQVEQQRTLTSKILHIHNCLNHLSFKTIQVMTANGHFPKNLVDCQIPICLACMFGKLSCCPWRTKSQAMKSIKLCTYSGQCVSVDQLESPTLGLIAQLKGIPTTKQYVAATIFVDHFSRLSFVHLQMSLSSEDTLQAKRAFERYCGSHSVQIQHYHADNGRFVDKLFIEDIRSENQPITYCGVNAHIQNGVAKKCIRDLQDLTGTAMLHASACWPRAFSPHLWPYALRCVNEVLILVPKSMDGKSAWQIFAGMSIDTDKKLCHPFGCPVYILDNKLQAGMKIHKWHTCARVGLYLGSCPMHANTVSLVLNLATGLVSPQFHIKFDESFETVHDLQDSNLDKWKIRCQFKTPEKGASANQHLSKGDPREKSNPMEQPACTTPPAAPQGPIQESELFCLQEEEEQSARLESPKKQ